MKTIAIFLFLLLGLNLISCAEEAIGNKVYVPLNNITFEQAEKQLFILLTHSHKSVVWPGGTETSGCYTNIDKERFLRSNYVKKLEDELRNNRNFLESVLALKKQDTEKIDDLISKLKHHRTYITWRELGMISPSGTTEAGSQVQLMISFYFTEIISEYLRLTEDQISSIKI